MNKSRQTGNVDRTPEAIPSVQNSAPENRPQLPSVPTGSVEDQLHNAQRIGRYAVLRQLGRGGMGVVLAAYDEELDRRVAVKVLHDRSAEAAEQRILREAQAMARVSHPNVVQIYEVGKFAQSDGRDSHIFIAMEFIDGTTLSDWQSAGERTWRELLDVYLAAGQGLCAAHQSGLVHRDFKPDNVLVGADGRPRVADFGLARGGEGEPERDLASFVITDGAAARSGSHLLASPLTQSGAIMGTPLYMSPEQYLGKLAGPRSDQFSFCVALYQSLYKARPFLGDTMESLGMAVLEGRLQPQPTWSPVPRYIHAAIERGLSTDPDKRFPSMQELLAALSFDPTHSPAEAPISRRLFSGSLLAMSIGLISIFIEPTLRKQNTVRMAMVSALMLFFGLSLAATLLRKTLLQNAFHRGIVFLILVLSGQEALIGTIAFLTGMTVAQTVAAELTALVAVSVSLTYLFFRRAWLSIPIVLAAITCVIYLPQEAGLIAMLVHVLCAVAAIGLWSRSADAPGWSR